jgi:transposase
MDISPDRWQEFLDAIFPHLDERRRRLILGAQARLMGRGGVSAVARMAGVSRPTVYAGLAELDAQPEATDPGRVRRKGGGRKPATATDTTLLRDLELLVEPVTRGDPDSPLRWTCKSLRVLSGELTEMGHQASPSLVMRLLHQLGYSLQANRKTNEGGTHADRDLQFEFINSLTDAFTAEGQPVVSVDAKKKELVGEFKNAGREYRPKGEPERVSVYDFVTEQGRATPFGVLDLARNEGWVSVGTDHDTADFAANSVLAWWHHMGHEAYPTAIRLLITADGGGSNGARVRLWKVGLQRIADTTGLEVWMCHFPPGTSKWNKIEHRMFSFISKNWRGKPLTSHEVIVNLIAATRTRKGLRINCALDTAKYPTARKVADDELAELNLTRFDFHGEWNYMVAPRPQQS